MEQNMGVIDSIQEDLIQSETIFHGLNSLNEYIMNDNENILLVNIRRLNCGYLLMVW